MEVQDWDEDLIPVRQKYSSEIWTEDPQWQLEQEIKRELINQ